MPSPSSACAARSAPARNACGVCTVTSCVPGDGLDHPRPVDPLDRVRDGQPRHRAVGPDSTAAITAANSASPGQRARRVVHDHDLGARGNRGQPGAHGRGPRRAPDHRGGDRRPVPGRRRPAARRRRRHSTRAAVCTARSTRRSDPTALNCLAPPNRAPEPAATTMAQVSTRQYWRDGVITSLGHSDSALVGGRSSGPLVEARVVRPREHHPACAGGNDRRHDEGDRARRRRGPRRR